MNARILRKWSIHTKNLMSCSACSLVVVVLLLLLLLVTCAPTLVLATMNSPPQLHPPPSRRGVDAAISFVVDTTQPQQQRQQPQPHHQHYMPKNVVEVGDAASAAAAATSSASASATSPLTGTPASASSSSSSLLSSSLPYRSHRLASSPRVEVAKAVVVSFPGFYTNRRIDDIQPTAAPAPPLRLQRPPPPPPAPQIPAHPRHIIKSSTSGDGVDVDVIDTRWIFHEDKEGRKDIVAIRGPWPRPYKHSSSHPSPKDLSLYSQQDSNDESEMLTSSSSARFSDNIERVRYNEGRPLNYPPSNHAFPLPLYALRQRDERRHHMTPASLPNQYQPQEAASQTPTTHLAIEADDKEEIEQEYRGHDDMYPQKLLSTTVNKSGVKSSQDNIFHTDNSNVNKMKPSAVAAAASRSNALPVRYVIESYEVATSNSRPQMRQSLATKQPQQQRLLLHHHQQQQQQQLKQLRTMQQQAARRRRDSLRGGAGGGGSISYNKRERYQSHDQQQQQHQHQHQQNFRKPHAYHHHNHNHNHNQHGRMRKHSRRYCSARDPAQLAFEAPTVFEGKIVSMTPDRRMNFSATVEVREVFKQQIGYRLQKYLRLQFAYRNTSGECDIYREQLRPRGLIKGDTIEPGRMYLLFVQQIDTGNFTILGQPIRKTKRVVDAVRYAVSESYAQPASIKSISASNRTMENGQELRIVCKVSGRPPPKVTWFKDHRSINRNRKLYQFTHYKKRSELIIHSFNTSDAGHYECRAKNKVNHPVEHRAIVIKAYQVQRFDPNPRGAGNNCPDDAAGFCFNGGTCKFFSEISSYSCICPEGFIGERCDRKEVNNPSTYSNEQECGDKKYFGSYYC